MLLKSIRECNVKVKTPILRSICAEAYCRLRKCKTSEEVRKLRKDFEYTMKQFNKLLWENTKKNNNMSVNDARTQDIEGSPQ